MWVRERSRVWSNNYQREVVEYVLLPLNEDQDMFTQLAVRLDDLVELIANEYRAFPDPGLWTLSIVMESMHGFQLLENRFGHRFGAHRRFTHPDQLADLATTIMDAVSNLAQSADEIELDELVFEVRFDRVPTARGRIKSHLKRAIAESVHPHGLCKYPLLDGYCGFQALGYALATVQGMREQWTGDLTWFDSLMKAGYPKAQQLRNSKKRFMQVCRYLAEQVHGNPDQGEWIMTKDDVMSTAERLVRWQPKLQVVVYHQFTKQMYVRVRGMEFDPSRAKQSTLLLSWAQEHVQLIDGVFTYFSKPYTHPQIFCYCCLRFFPRAEHACADFQQVQCPCCLTLLLTKSHYDQHCEWEGKGVECPRCERRFFNPRCEAAHQCLAQHVAICRHCRKRLYRYDAQQHECGTFTCSNCREQVQVGHRCAIQRLDEPDWQAPEEAGVDYYAFDLESMLLPQANGGTLHEVNLVVVCRCFSQEQWVFPTMEAFVRWLEQVPGEPTFFAHNMKGYDGRMVFEYLFDKHTPPQEMVWQGSKIMQMKYGRATFMDTLLHLPASLEQLPGMFALDPAQFKKGFFPYRFNTPENQQYVGRIPDRSYFDPGHMSVKKRRAFDAWYAEQETAQEPYDFHRELVAYCVSDTQILARAIESYMRQQMSARCLNPFSCLTIASYAMKMYRTYFMPENTIARLTSTEEEEIRPAMHGGRTDARCLLKEWTDAEVERGVYGKYQDVQSLYPTVQFYDPLPVGPPVKTAWLEDVQPTEEQVRQVFGFVCCDLEPTQYLHHPILVEINPETGRLVADLLPKTRVTVPTPELHLAMDYGYRVTRVYYWYHFDSSTDLFKPYFREFLRHKIEASGVPKWVRTDEDWQEFYQEHVDRLGMALDREAMQPNPSRKTGAKLLCNSLWGKFGERFHVNAYQMFQVGDQDDRILELENKWIDGDIDITHRKYSGDGRSVCMVYNYANDKLDATHIHKRKHRGHRSIAMAAMITSHARCRLWKELNKLGDRVLYHDTDSIIYEHRPDAYNIPEGRYLGEWEDETGGCPIIRFVSTGPKCYSYVVRQPDGSLKTETKVKGITLHTHNKALIHYESMKALVTGELDVVRANSLLFKYDRNKGTMVTQTVQKLFKNTYGKGVVHPTTYRVYPFGWDRFLPAGTMN